MVAGAVVSKWASALAPAPLWQTTQLSVTPGYPWWALWAPFRLGRAPIVGSASFGGVAWQEVQSPRVRGEPSSWQLLQAGPTAEGPPPRVLPWHRAQAVSMLPAEAWLVASAPAHKGSGWALKGPWQPAVSQPWGRSPTARLKRGLSPGPASAGVAWQAAQLRRSALASGPWSSGAVKGRAWDVPGPSLWQPLVLPSVLVKLAA